MSEKFTGYVAERPYAISIRWFPEFKPMRGTIEFTIIIKLKDEYEAFLGYDPENTNTQKLRLEFDIPEWVIPEEDYQDFMQAIIERYINWYWEHLGKYTGQPFQIRKKN